MTGCNNTVSSYSKIIDQKILESGHPQMECDSMHSAIEFAKRKTNVYIPSQWDTVIHVARRHSPYVVVPIRQWDFILAVDIESRDLYFLGKFCNDIERGFPLFGCLTLIDLKS
jgi:hypothetical protein